MSYGLPTQFIWLLTLILLFVLIGLVWWWKNENQWWQRSFWRYLSRENNKKIRLTLRFLLLFLSFSLLTFSVFRPQWGENTVVTEKNGVSVLFALDVSKSMKALDMSLKERLLDRLTAAKLLISDMVVKHPENNYGLVVFAGDAFVLSPITFDTDSFINILDSASTDDVIKQGTDLARALQVSLDRFSDTESDNKKASSRAIVLISDGGEEETTALSVQIERAKKMRVPVYTLGIGSVRGVPIPEGRDVFGDIVYKKYHGKTVYTKLNEKPLKKIAHLTGGEYWHLSSGEQLEEIAGKLNTLNSSLIKQESPGGKEDQYQLFLFWSLVSFVVYLLLSGIDFNFIDRWRKKLFV